MFPEMEESSNVRIRRPTPSRSVQDTADRLNDALPVKLAAEDIEDNPELVHLLTSLSLHIEESGITKACWENLQQAEASMKQQKIRWLRNHVLYLELQEWLLEQQIASGVSKDSEQAKFSNAVQECLTFAEAGDYLDCNTDPTIETSLLGLKQEDLERTNPYQKHIQSLQQALIPEIEGRLKKKCEQLVQFHEPDTNVDSQEASKFAFAKATQLPGIIENETLGLHNEEKQLKKDRTNRDRQFWLYYQSLMSSLGTLERIIMKHRLQSQAENDNVSSEWLTARCDAMCLKIKVFELRILCETYYAGTVEALTKIRNLLEQSSKTTQREISQSSQALKAYEAVGMGFDSLVQDYADLLDQIDNKRWALRELNQTMT